MRKIYDGDLFMVFENDFDREFKIESHYERLTVEVLSDEYESFKQGFLEAEDKSDFLIDYLPYLSK